MWTSHKCQVSSRGLTLKKWLVTPETEGQEDWISRPSLRAGTLGDSQGLKKARTRQVHDERLCLHGVQNAMPTGNWLPLPAFWVLLGSALLCVAFVNRTEEGETLKERRGQREDAWFSMGTPVTAMPEDQLRACAGASIPPTWDSGPAVWLDTGL